MKKMMVAAAAVMMSAMMAFPALAKTEIGRDETGNGITIWYDDGSMIDYNARGSSLTYYDEDGSEYTYDDVQLTSSDFSRYTRTSSGSSSSKYDDARVTDAYWDYSGGKCTARWDADYRSKGKYTITLYRDGHKVTTRTSSGGSSVNFSDDIADCGKTGDYSFTVKGKWSGGITDEADSDELTVNSDRMALIRGRGNSGSSSGSSNPGSGPAAATTGWQWVNNSWKYQRPNGTYAANCWEQVNGKMPTSTDGASTPTVSAGTEDRAHSLYKDHSRIEKETTLPDRSSGSVVILCEKHHAEDEAAEGHRRKNCPERFSTGRRAL